MKNRLTRSQLIVFGFILTLLVTLTSPFWLWQFKGEMPVDMLILGEKNKGLQWLLKNEKVKKMTAIASDKPLSSTQDVYYLSDQTEKLSDEGMYHLEKDLILSGNKTMIAEYSTLANAGTDTTREKMENLLNIRSKGWTGKYFPALEGGDLPSWIKENYGEKWEFTGPGIVLVTHNGFVIVLNGKDLQGNGLSFQSTKKGIKQLGSELQAQYQGWFNLVEAKNEEEILASYTLPITKEAKTRLKGYGIPDRFPAVIHHQNAKYTSYYFAGDFSSEADAPGIYQTSGIAWWKQHTSDSFYWRSYVPMMKKILSSGLDLKVKQQKIEIVKKDSIQTNSQTSDATIQIQKNGKWEDLLVKGVNMGIAKPGAFPGETAIAKEEYFRWFKAIGDMNANAIRVYTIHPPAFYEAFYEYNQIAAKPLYLFHGAWVNEENLVHYQDAFHPEVRDDFQQEIKHMIDIVHGHASLPERPGHASGKYTYDISPYVLGFILGIEWDPSTVINTNSKHQAMKPFNGQYFTTKQASPFESWLAQMMDFAAAYETDNYQWQHTMSFTNWVTTDLLTHPAEPSEEEDLVAVDPNHIVRTDDFHAGLFASYHVYPYYPDFMNYEKKYTDYLDSEGKKNNYAGYLHDLLSVHQMPVLIAEFGVPESRGLTHVNVDGMDQGLHSEEEQGQINKRLFQSITDEGAAGGLVFTWQDEWFKRTWNTMDYDNPDRRPYWSNRQTNEQHFGLLGFEPGEYEPPIYPDGQKADWEKLKVKPVYEAAKQSINKVFVTSDEENIYFRLDYRNPVDPDHLNTQLLIDTISNQGQSSIPIQNEQVIQTDFGVDFLINLKNQSQSRILVDSYYDSYYFHYGQMLKMIPKADYASQKNNGIFHPIRLALNKELTVPSTGQKLPFVFYETGQLKFGNGNPLYEDFNSLTDISISHDKKTIELRLPWALFNLKDPSQKEIIGNLWEKGLNASETIDGIRIAVVTSDQENNISSFPSLKNGKLMAENTASYSWSSWEQPASHERLKDSYRIMKEVFQQY